MFEKYTTRPHLLILYDSDLPSSPLEINNNNFGGPNSFLLILQTYIKYHLPVAKNIVALYKYWKKEGYETNYISAQDAAYATQHAPELEYKTKYYPCIRRQLKKDGFIYEK